MVERNMSLGESGEGYDRTLLIKGFEVKEGPKSRGRWSGMLRMARHGGWE